MSKIFEKRKATKLRRQKLSCKVFELKVDVSHLSKNTIKHLNSLFKEAKWFYNYCLSQEDINNSNTTLKSVPVKVKDIFEDRTFTSLTSQMKQAIKGRIFGSLVSLKSRKTKGYKVGRLKFKKKINSIPLTQNNKTFFLDKQRSRIRIQGLKNWLKVSGLSQLPSISEIANSTLIKKSNNFYLHITTFTEKEVKIVPEISIGIDFGCATQLSLSDGTKIEIRIPPSKRLRRLDRRIMRKQKFSKKKRDNSKKKYQDTLKRQKEYKKITDKKKDIKNKVVSAITKNYKYVCFQDESIKGWMSSNHGKSVQFSGIGAIISDLKNKSDTPLEVNKFFPSTQLCPVCGNKKKLTLDERIYYCDSCGYKEDRDLHAARNIETEGLKQLNKSSKVQIQIPVDYRDFKTREISSAVLFDILSKISNIKVSKMKSLN